MKIMKILEFQMRTNKIMKIIEFNVRLTKIMKIIESHWIIKNKFENTRILVVESRKLEII